MAVKVCPVCGEGNKETALVCVICGGSLREIVPQGTRDSDKDFKRSKPSQCRHCHEPLEEGALRCKHCGTIASRPPAKQSYSIYDDEALNSIPDSFALTLLVIVTILIPIVGLIVGGVASFSDDRDKRETGKMLLVIGAGMLIIQAVIFFFFIR